MPPRQHEGRRRRRPSKSHATDRAAEAGRSPAGWVGSGARRTPLGSRGSRAEPEGSGASLGKVRDRNPFPHLWLGIGDGPSSFAGVGIGNEPLTLRLWFGIGANPPPSPPSKRANLLLGPLPEWRGGRARTSFREAWVPGRIRGPGRGPDRIGPRGDSLSLHRPGIGCEQARSSCRLEALPLRRLETGACTHVPSPLRFALPALSKAAPFRGARRLPLQRRPLESRSVSVPSPLRPHPKTVTESGRGQADSACGKQG